MAFSSCSSGTGQSNPIVEKMTKLTNELNEIMENTEAYRQHPSVEMIHHAVREARKEIEKVHSVQANIVQLEVKLNRDLKLAKLAPEFIAEKLNTQFKEQMDKFSAEQVRVQFRAEKFHKSARDLYNIWRAEMDIEKKGVGPPTVA